VAVEEVVVLPIDGVLDYGSRGGVNKNSIQQSAVSFSTWHLALGTCPSAAAVDAIENGARADWGGLRRCSGYEDER